MTATSTLKENFSIPALMEEASDYVVDTWQRAFLFTDILRKRGNTYFSHLKENQPPVLSFDYEIILSGKDLDRPVNYSLAQVFDRRSTSCRRSGDEDIAGNRDKRKAARRVKKDQPSRTRPIVIIDPRAGHGPGIGGSKRDSEIGMALDLKHPVYFILFDTDPIPEQTLADVHQAEIRFLEEVKVRHPEPKDEKPAIIGNCQAGWAAMLLASDRPDVAGPLVLNGSPLSYWAGVEGSNPMRYKGGLSGGTWQTSLWCDLGNGKFDGANLVAGFEDLNPANTYWKKLYNVYSNVDTEEKRFLDFEKWWNGFYFMTSQEIKFIVKNLFVGNRLERGILQFHEGSKIDMKNIKSPILVFASSGDNITPPPQALNWIIKVWGSVEEIKRCEQVIVYLLHETIGHLGIFVSGKVSKKEHKQILASVDLMDYLAPGLYEMIITPHKNGMEAGDYEVGFQKREMEDILKLDDTLEDEEEFKVVSTVSELGDTLYNTFVSPWVRSMTTRSSAYLLRQLHPLRVPQYIFSDLNPAMIPVRIASEEIQETRKPAGSGNIFRAWEKFASETVSEQLDLYRKIRDDAQEKIFQFTYSNPFVEAFFEPFAKEEWQEEDKSFMFSELKTAEEQYWQSEVVKGGFMEGVLRIMAAIAGVDHEFSREELRLMRRLVQYHNILTNTQEEKYRSILRDQARVLQVHGDAAIDALPDLIRGPENRLVAIQIAEVMAEADETVNDPEKKLLARIKTLLEDQKTL